jgi:hypothetical protein
MDHLFNSPIGRLLLLGLIDAPLLTNNIMMSELPDF